MLRLPYTLSKLLYVLDHPWWAGFNTLPCPLGVFFFKKLARAFCLNAKIRTTFKK
ncbi:hypothetical protein Hanom_Chr12g01085091 [Helianthus anomalus]